MGTSKQNQASLSQQDGLLSARQAAAQLEGLVSLLLGLEFTKGQSSPGKESSDQCVGDSQAWRAPYDSGRHETQKRVGTGSYTRDGSEKLWQLGTEDRAVGFGGSYVGYGTEALSREEKQPDRQRSTASSDNSVHQAGEAATGSSYSQQPGDNEIGKALEALSSLLLGTTTQRETGSQGQQGSKSGSQSSASGSTEGLLVMQAELESASVQDRGKSWSSPKVASEILVTEAQLVTPDSQRNPTRESEEGSEYDVEDLAASLETLGNLLTGRQKQEKSPSQQSKVEKTKISVESELESGDASQQAQTEVGSSVAQKVAQRTGISSEEGSESQPASPEVESLVKTAASSLGAIAGLESDDLRAVIAKIEQKLADIERQTGVINPLMPLVSELIGMDLTLTQEESIRVIVPIIDKVIQERSREDREGMSAALADLLPGAISQQIKKSPQEIAKAIGPEIGAAIKEQIRIERDSISEALAPEMGRAIKAQIELERDSMVDALYPVIGSTISKYMAEVIRSINEKVENTLSPEGIKRKIRATMQGVSEAELILQESKGFATQAVFLIHKESGLVIAEAQPDSEQRMESEMVAGMLTAIRSFVNDCIVQSGEMSELDAIDYGESKIILEVAGYSYLAVVVKGEASKQFIAQVRQAMGTIVQRYGKQVEEFEGDTETIPEQVVQVLEKLLQTSSKEKASKSPTALLAIAIVVLSAVLLPWAIHQQHSRRDQLLEDRTVAAIASAPELSVYNIAVEAAEGTLILKGRVPNEYLRLKAEDIVKNQVPGMAVDNQIIAVEVPPDPVLAAKEVARVTKMLNSSDGVSISTHYEAGNVTVKGTVFEAESEQLIEQALAEIPGVSSVLSTLQLKLNPLNSRIYFDLGSAELHPGDASSLLLQIEEFLHEYPEIHLMVIGHSDRIGNRAKNQQLSIQRAMAVKRTLESMGIDPRRLQVFGTVKNPPDVSDDSPPELSRCVRFELFIPVGKGE